MLRSSLERRLPDPPVTRLTGLRLSEVGLGLASAWMSASGWWQSAAGVFLAASRSTSGHGVLGLAEPGEVLVSSTVRDLVAGSGIEFDDRDEHTLKGIVGPWRLYAARAG